MGQKAYCYLTGTIFALVALAHLIRIVFNWSIYIDEIAIPVWISWPGCIVPALLAGWALRLATRPDRTA